MLACHGVTPCLWMGLCHHMVPDRPGRVTELRQRDAWSTQGPSGRAADLLPALAYHYSPAPRPFRPHHSLATRYVPSHPYHPPPHNPVTSGLCRSSGISLETHGRGEPTHTKHHRGRRMGRRCKGLCRSSGISLETPGRGESTAQNTTGGGGWSGGAMGSADHLVSL